MLFLISRFLLSLFSLYTSRFMLRVSCFMLLTSCFFFLINTPLSSVLYSFAFRTLSVCFPLVFHSPLSKIPFKKLKCNKSLGSTKDEAYDITSCSLPCCISSSGNAVLNLNEPIVRRICDLHGFYAPPCGSGLLKSGTRQELMARGNRQPVLVVLSQPKVIFFPQLFSFIA